MFVRTSSTVGKMRRSLLTETFRFAMSTQSGCTEDRWLLDSDHKRTPVCWAWNVSDDSFCFKSIPLTFDCWSHRKLDTPGRNHGKRLCVTFEINFMVSLNCYETLEHLRVHAFITRSAVVNIVKELNLSEAFDIRHTEQRRLEDSCSEKHLVGNLSLPLDNRLNFSTTFRLFLFSTFNSSGTSNVDGQSANSSPTAVTRAPGSILARSGQ